MNMISIPFQKLRGDDKDSDEGIILNNSQPNSSDTNINDNSMLDGEINTELRRSLTFYDGLNVLIGIMIGSGIFASPGLALKRSGSSLLFLMAWLGAGFLVFCSALNYMELAAMMPNAGGDFAFLKRAYGDNAAFTYAWYNFWISKTGSQAIIATIFGEYIAWIIGVGNVGDGNIASKIFAILLTIALAVINCCGIRESANLQNLLTTIKLGLVIFVFIAAVVSGIYDHSNTLIANFSNDNASNGSVFGFFTAMVAALWAFDGWADLNFLAEELYDPSRNIPRVMTIGIGIVTLVYLLANVAYLIVLLSEQIEDATAIAIDFGYSAGGNRNNGAILATFLAAGVAIATAGSDNGSIMTGGRAFFAVARDGFAPAKFSELNRAGAPWASLVAQCIWTCVLLLLPGSSFSALLDYFGPVSWVFYAWTSSAVIQLRKSEPNASRPFKIPYYPLPPIITGVIAIMIMISSLMKGDAFYTILAIIFCALAIPVKVFGIRWFEFLSLSQVNNNGSNSNNITMIDSSGMMSLSLHDVDEAFSDATINDENDDNGYYDYDNNHSNGDRDIENN